MGQTKMKNVTLQEILYYIFWGIMLFAKGTGMIEGSTSFKICLVVSAFALACKLVMSRYKVYEAVFVVLLVGIAAYIYFSTGNMSALLVVGVAVGLKGMDERKVMYVGAVIWILSFLGTVLLSLTGIHQGTMLVHEKLGLGPVLRWSMGYTHPNVLHISYVIFMVFALYLWNQKKHRKQWLMALALFAGNLYIFMYSMSFTGFLMAIIFLVIYIYLFSHEELLKIDKILVYAVIPCCLLFAFGAPFLDQNSYLFNRINNILNTRLLASKVYLQSYPITWFGTRFDNRTSFALDSSYITAFLGYGVILFLLIVAGYLFTVHYYIKRKEKLELAVICALLIAGITEPFLFNTSFKNITLVFLGVWFYSGWGTRLGEWCNKEIGVKEIAIHVRTRVWKKNMVDEKESIKPKIPMIFLIFLIAIIFSGCIVSIKRYPDSIYINTQNSDCGVRKEKYLDIDNLPHDFNSDIYGYVDKNVPMYEFEGNIIKLEIVREFVSISLIIWAIGICCVWKCTGMLKKI